METTSRSLVLALLALCLAACNNGGSDPVRPDGADRDGDTSDTRPDGPTDSPPDDGGPTPALLRERISIDLSTVVSLAVSAGSGAKAAGDPGLYALTESGEIVPVSFVEGSDGSLSSYPEPPIQRIYPTPEWILFATWDWHATMLDGDGGITSVPCATLAAHRDTGRLFCSALGIGDITAGWGNTDPRSTSVHPNAAGDVVYVSSANGLGQNVIYRLDLDPELGPTGTLVPDVVGVNWVVVNATGDLLVNFKPSAYDPAVLTRIIPLDGSAPFNLEGTGLLPGSWTFAIAGEPGTVDEDVFYFLDSADVGGTNRRVLHAVARGGTGFADTTHVLTLLDPILLTPIDCGFPHRLALVVQDGSVIETPTQVPLENIERPLDVGGLPWRFAPGRVALFATDGTNRKFIRYDGVTQDDILVPSAYELQGFGISLGGDIDFLANDTSTGTRVRGTVPVGTTEITILSAVEIDLAETVTFTRIN
jgi:hypothetical protein